MKLIGMDEARTALMLCLIEPKLSGVLLVGKSGVGKSSLLQEMQTWCNLPFVRMPLGVDEERLLGGHVFEKSLRGDISKQKGLLEQAKGGFLVSENSSLHPSFVLEQVFNTQEKYNFSLLSTYNPNDEPLNAHFLDRIDLCVNIEVLEGESQRAKVVKNHFLEKQTSLSPLHVKSVAYAKETLNKLHYSDEILKLCVELAKQSGAEGHRGEKAIALASKAYAALMGDEVIEKKHVEKVAPLCLMHRQREVQPPLEDEPQEEDKTPPPPPQESNDQNQGERENNEHSPENQEENDDNSPENSSNQGFGKEEVMKANGQMKIRKLWLEKDKIVRKGSGLRTPTKTEEKRGRTIRTRTLQSEDISIVATIRAAAPWQHARGRQKDEFLRIEPCDIQTRQREAKSAYTVIMVVDASGSMGAKERIKEAKSACLGLLKDAYTKREEVAIIAFRGNSAEIVVQPTRAVSLVKERLDAIPVGGKTPLAFALREVYELTRKIRKKEPTRRILTVIISDAKANIGLEEKAKPWDGVKLWAGVLKEMEGSEYIVVNTESKGLITFGKAKELSLLLDAQYFDLESLGDGGMIGLLS